MKEEVPENHIHSFAHTGGGCGVSSMVGYACDDDYKCYCGAKIRVYSPTPEVHFTMPRRISGRRPPEPIEVDFGEDDAPPVV